MVRSIRETPVRRSREHQQRTRLRAKIASDAASLRAGGQEALAQFFEKSRATSAALRQSYLDGARGLLSISDQQRLDHLLADGPRGPKVHLLPEQLDTITLARTGRLTVEDVLKRNRCDMVVEACL